MLERYTRKEMAQLFSELRKKRGWHDVEVAVLQARGRLGQIPEGIAEQAGEFDVTEETLERANEIEKMTDHDLIAFVKAVVEQLPEEVRPYYHGGLTSYDVEDTALALVMAEALDLIITSVKRLRDIIALRADENRLTYMVGRTHHIHAKPITFGLKLLGYVDALDFHLDQLKSARKIVAVGKLSGAVGTYTLSPEVEKSACENLGLEPARISTQIISRHVHVHYAMTLTALANSLDKFATDIRLLAGTDIGEVAEFKRLGNKGSSAMPGKSRLRNPIKSENVCSLAKLARGYLLPALECQTSWNERTLDNSAAERVWLPDLTAIVHFMTERFADVMEKLEVYTDQMRANMEKTGGIIYGENVMNAMTGIGMDRQAAYDVVEGWALATNPGTFRDDEGRSFRDLAFAYCRTVCGLDIDQIKRCFEPALEYVDAVFARFGL